MNENYWLEKLPESLGQTSFYYIKKNVLIFRIFMDIFDVILNLAINITKNQGPDAASVL